jgi:hypothetical protein
VEFGLGICLWNGRGYGEEVSCKRIETKFDFGGVRGSAALWKRAFVFPHLERFSDLSSGIDAACTAPLTPPHPSPRWGEGNRGRFIFSQLQGSRTDRVRENHDHLVLINGWYVHITHGLS